MDAKANRAISQGWRRLLQPPQRWPVTVGAAAPGGHCWGPGRTLGIGAERPRGKAAAEIERGPISWGEQVDPLQQRLQRRDVTTATLTGATTKHRTMEPLLLAARSQEDRGPKSRGSVAGKMAGCWRYNFESLTPTFHPYRACSPTPTSKKQHFSGSRKTLMWKGCPAGNDQWQEGHLSG